jgi:predicted dehydrogenase
VASRDLSRAVDYAAGRGIPRAYGTYDELLADEAVEAVYIPLPNALHVDWTIEALEAGKHVLCEKPLHGYASEVERAFHVAERTQRLLMEAFMWRHHPATTTMQEIVSAGAVGDLRHIRSSFTVPYRERGEDIRLNPELDGGALMDVGCYPINAVRLFAGEPLSVNARFRSGPTGVDLHVVGMLFFEDDVSAAIDGGFDLPPRSTIEIVGTSGTLVAEWPFFPREEPSIRLRVGERVESYPVADVNRYRAQVENFCRAIRGKERPLLGRADAVGQARTLEALRASALHGGEPVAVRRGS